MVWPAQSPDLNCFEMPWGIAKHDLYANGKQYQSKPELKEAVVNILSNIEGSLIIEITGYMDSRIKVLKANKEYIKM